MEELLHRDSIEGDDCCVRAQKYFGVTRVWKEPEGLSTLPGDSSYGGGWFPQVSKPNLKERPRAQSPVSNDRGYGGTWLCCPKTHGRHFFVSYVSGPNLRERIRGVEPTSELQRQQYQC